MARSTWKRREREAARLVGGVRHPANTGGFVDCESDSYVIQVKERGRCSLTELETLALEIDRVATQKQKAGLILVKRSAGRGHATPWLVVMTAATFRHLNGALPMDPPPC